MSTHIPFPFMGLSESDAFFFAERDLAAIEYRFTLRPEMPFGDERQNSTSKSREEEEEEDSKIRTSSSESFPSCLQGKLPAPAEESTVADDDDGFKTPTSEDHKIPAIFRCPPAPRKEKPRKLSKRKAQWHDRVFLDQSREIESTCCMVFDGVDSYSKIKKVKQATDKE